MTNIEETKNVDNSNLIEENSENQSSNKLLNGEYLLTPLQVLILNKKLPPGFKLELEEIYLKTAADIPKETTNMIGKKRKKKKYSEETKSKKKVNKNKEISANEEEDESNEDKADLKRSAREKKPNLKDDLGFIENKVKCKDPKLIEISKRCEKIIQKLKKNPDYELFTSSISNEISSLLDIEKKVKNFVYSSIHSFSIEVRKIWNHHFSKANSPEMYKKIFEISQQFEEILGEVEHTPIESLTIESITKKLQKIESQISLQEKTKISNFNSSQYLTKTQSKQNTSISEKPMTLNEKNELGKNIRKLSDDQKKNIINILSDQCSLDKSSKFFEFDIEKLSTKKLRELEKYVKKCLKSKNKSEKDESINKTNIKENNKPQTNTTTQQPIKSNNNPHPKKIESSDSSDDDSESLSSLNFKK